MGQLLPHFNDIEPEEDEEPLPQIGGAKYHTWHEVTGELLNPAAQQRQEEQELPPLVQIMPEPDVELPHAPSGRPPFGKLKDLYFYLKPLQLMYNVRLKQWMKTLFNLLAPDEEEHSAHSPEERDHFPSLGGGGGGGGYRLPSSFETRRLSLMIDPDHDARVRS